MPRYTTGELIYSRCAITDGELKSRNVRCPEKQPASRMETRKTYHTGSRIEGLQMVFIFGSTRDLSDRMILDLLIEILPSKI